MQNEGESKMYNTEEKCIELSKKFREICEAKGSTPYKLARKAGISSSTKANENWNDEQLAELALWSEKLQTLKM